MKTITGRAATALCATLFFCVASASFAATRTATNGILTIQVEDAGSELGMFSVQTGASHPQPNQRVLYPIGTSYITLRDNTAQEIWTNSGGAPNTGIAPYVSRSMQTAPATAAIVNTANGFQVTYTLPNWVVVQDLVLAGTTLSDTSVRQTVTVRNTSTATRSYGVRYMWDWMIAGNDASFFRTRNPDGTFTNVFQAFAPPGFQAFEEVNSLTTPAFSVFGTVQGGTLVPAPTAPDRLGYVSWGTSESAPWDFAVTGSGGDSSTVHYWGYTTALSLAPGGSTAFTEYLSTNPNAVGVGPAAPLVQVPTLSEWALIALAGLLGLFGLRAASRRA
jgi:hypothetical protein